MYGGTAQLIPAGTFVSGLSPRVRGNRSSALSATAFSRSIPACTGEPASNREPAAAPGVYPRVYGGTVAPQHLAVGGGGLSPRVRGNPHCPPVQPPDAGSIPACTGEPRPSCGRRCAKRVYPRVYGGTKFSAYALFDMRGLSPRVRGNPAHRISSGSGQRSIPACTGEPYPRFAEWACNAVYPRVYGGTARTRQRDHRDRGLSPRVRGNLRPLPQGVL